ncbi:MAG: PKD domain-containing protein [Bacteroidetes bacterium]|nr:PKD domain-containing protein [Bacteroidota bacterium]
MKTYRFFFYSVLFLFAVGQANGQTNFKASPTQGCVPLNVSFTDLTVGAVQWEWDFGNGNKSTLKNASAIYYNSGKFTVTLTTWDNTGNKTSITKTNVIRAFKNPVAAFTANPRVVCVGEKMTFTSNSTPGDTGIVKYSWDMGDGTLVNQVTPGYAYKSAGTYNVSLVVIDGHGCQDKLLKNGYVRVKPTPTASFLIDSGYNCEIPTTIHFTNKSKGGNLTYNWDFGDGAKSTAQNPSHKYTNYGSYAPTLTVTDTNGCSYTYTVTGGVFLGPITADFTASKTTLCGPGNVDFNLTGKLVGSVIYEWDFGDGGTATKASPSHYYSKEGKYTVKLTARALYRNCTTVVEKKNLITVNPLPKGTISVSDSFPCEPPFAVQLKYNDPKGFKTINWMYELDGKVYSGGSSQTLNLLINDYKSRKYKALVENKEGCKDTITLDWAVKADSVVADFSGDTSGCQPILARFKDQSVSDYKVKSWDWTFHDGTKSYNKTASKLYLDSGRFKVKLIVITEHGCKDSVVKMVNAGYKTSPSFKILSALEICNNSDTIHFYNTTKYPGFNIDSFRWVYDSVLDRTRLKIPLSQKSYKSTDVWATYDRDTGWLTLQLISYHHGCPDTMTMRDTIYIKPPFAKIEITPDPCYSNKLIVKNISKLYTRFEWIVDKIKYTDDSLLLDVNSAHTIILRLWNDTAGCYDTAKIDYLPSPDKVELCGAKLSSNCTPAVLTNCLKEANDVTQGFWTLNGTDTVWTAGPVKYNLDTAGKYILTFHLRQGLNCYKTFSETVTVTNGVLKGSVTKPATCMPATIQLIDSGWAPGPVKHAWRMSNGDVVLATSQVVNYVLQNSYTDTLEIRLTNEPNVGLCKPVKIFYIPTNGPGVRLSYAWQNTCSTSTFIANADANPNKGVKPFSFSWNMGDGSTFGSQFVSYKYQDTGWYTVSVTVTDANGCKATDIKRIYIPEFRLDVKITSDTFGSGCPPLYVNFQDISTALGTAIKSWEWDFGDGSYSTLKNPQHQYLIPGRFTVKLKIVDALGCTRTKIFPDFIVISGPYGKFKFDKTEGCYPLSVQFEDSFSSNTFKTEWDFGDGIVGTNKTPKHAYTKPGRYIPAVILSDSFGCKIPLPPVDTIYVYDYPQADFTYAGICLRDSVSLQSTSYTRDEPLAKWEWILEGNSTVDKVAFRYLFGSRNTQVRHIVTTTKGCSDTMDKIVPLKQPQVSYLSFKDTLCLGNTWKGYGKYKLDTALQSKVWLLNNNYYSAADNIQFTANKSGQYRFVFRVEDVAGCWDTFSKPHPISVGDTVIPPMVPLLRVSVVEDMVHDIKFRKFPTFDFSGYSVLREEGGIFTPVLNVSGRADTLHYLYGVDALHQSYCYKVSTRNLCGFTQDIQILPVHCTVEVSGKPDTNVSLLKWNNYTGWPVKQYDVYRENLQNPGTFDSIGTTDGNTTWYNDSSIACYINHVYVIKANESNGNLERSWSDTCHVKPIYLNIVPAPEIRRATVVNDKYVRLEWDEIKKNRQPIDFYEIEKANAQGKFQWLFTSPFADSFVYKDLNTQVDDYSYLYQLRAVDVCGDKSDYSNPAKSILLQTDVNKDYRPVLNWTAYREWPEGVKQYVVEKRSGTGNFEEVGRTVPEDTFYIDNISGLNCIPVFEYRVYAIRNNTPHLPFAAEIRSYSNVDGPPIETKIFIPNAYTPDANHLNDVFKPIGIYIASYTMKIYTRWGEKVYEGSECDNSWNGYYNGSLAPNGVYAYLVNAIGADGKRYVFSGDVTLMR